MTNQAIILHESLVLMEQGKLKGTGKYATVEIDGKEKQIEVPEEIHTFNGWKNRGYMVRKGEHSNIKFMIWKPKAQKKDENEEEPEGICLNKPSMFLKMSAFFTIDQVDAITQ